MLRPTLGSRRAPDTAKPLLCLKELGGFAGELGKLSGSLTKLMHSFSSGDLVTISGVEQEQGEALIRMHGGKRGIF